VKDGKPEDLREYLATHCCKGFTPGGHYNAAGEWIYFFRDEFCIAEVVDERLTLFHAVQDGKVTGDVVGYKFVWAMLPGPLPLTPDVPGD
jgi:hypothetical protein